MSAVVIPVPGERQRRGE